MKSVICFTEGQNHKHIILANNMTLSGSIIIGDYTISGPLSYNSQTGILTTPYTVCNSYNTLLYQNNNVSAYFYHENCPFHNNELIGDIDIAAAENY